MMVYDDNSAINPETSCSDTYDNDCDSNADSNDGDCCIPAAGACSSGSGCCSSPIQLYCSKKDLYGDEMPSSDWHCCSTSGEYWDPVASFGAGACIPTGSRQCSTPAGSPPTNTNGLRYSPTPYEEACCSVNYWGPNGYTAWIPVKVY